MSALHETSGTVQREHADGGEAPRSDKLDSAGATEAL